MMGNLAQEIKEISRFAGNPDCGGSQSFVRVEACRIWATNGHCVAVVNRPAGRDEGIGAYLKGEPQENAPEGPPIDRSVPKDPKVRVVPGPVLAVLRQVVASVKATWIVAVEFGETETIVGAHLPEDQKQIRRRIEKRLPDPEWALSLPTVKPSRPLKLNARYLVDMCDLLRVSDLSVELEQGRDKLGPVQIRGPLGWGLIMPIRI